MGVSENSTRTHTTPLLIRTSTLILTYLLTYLSSRKMTTHAADESRYSIDLEYGDSVKVRKMPVVLSRQTCKRVLYALGATVFLITVFFCCANNYLECRRRLPEDFIRKFQKGDYVFLRGLSGGLEKYNKFRGIVVG